MKNWPAVILVGCGTCVVLCLGVGTGGVLLLRHIGKELTARVENFDQSQQPWIECSVPHPGGTPALTFMEKSIHPFLAEYEYRVRFGTGSDAVERWLPLNCGGRTRMNAYWYEPSEQSGPCIRLQDHWGEYLLRLDEQKTYLILRYEGHVLAGEISESSPGYSVSQRGAADGEPEIHASVGGNEAVDITDTAVGRGPGRYFGRIDGQSHPIRFIPASESPEIKIEMH
jgi:hypothetical protein